MVQNSMSADGGSWGGATPTARATNLGPQPTTRAMSP